jgi:hypothetical protein
MPNFLIIGAIKSGTTSLYYYLKQHPQIYMSPVKEPAFFAFEGAKPASWEQWRRWRASNYITRIEAYRALFQGVTNEMAIGEATPIYLIHPGAPECIRHYIPDAKLIVILRDPVECVYSTYLMRRLHGDESSVDFAQTICSGGRGTPKAERLRQRYIDLGFYYAHLKRYFDIFDPAQIEVYLYEDFKIDPGRILQDVFRFLGVDEAFMPDMSIKYSVGGIPKNRVWHTFFLIKPFLRLFIPATLRQRGLSRLANLQRRGLVKPPPLEPDVRTELIRIYREDILKLQQLIQRDLSGWLEGSMAVGAADREK